MWTKVLRRLSWGQEPPLRSSSQGLTFDLLGSEEVVVESKGNKLLLAGGRPRGTLYAVNRFLEKECGVRWWAPWATDIPHNTTVQVQVTTRHEKPAFDYRAPFWYPGLNLNGRSITASNSSFNNIPKSLGGCIQYKGHAHTFYPLVPPDKHFKRTSRVV